MFLRILKKTNPTRINRIGLENKQLLLLTFINKGQMFQTFAVIKTIKLFQLLIIINSIKHNSKKISLTNKVQIQNKHFIEFVKTGFEFEN